MTPEAEAFLKSAMRFCQWSENEPHEVPIAREILIDLIKDIPRLECWRDIAPIEDEFEGRGIQDWNEDVRRFKDLPFQCYLEVFDPHNFEKQEILTKDVATDLADIYGDLFQGCQALKAGYEEEALRIMVSSYFAHWGYHSSSALRAIDEYYQHYYQSEQGAGADAQ